MSVAVYPEYKDSGVEWLGPVPFHWELSKIKHNATLSCGGTPTRDNPAFWGGSIPWVSPKDMKSPVIDGAEEYISDSGLANSATNLVAAGAVLMVVRSGILRHTIPVAINAVGVALNQDMKALRFDDSRCLPQFFFYWVQGLNDELLLAWAKQGATVESIEHAYLADSTFPLPPLPEQTAIASFLDRETGKIDALVAEQRRLISLLKEKRQAVISHAVTKGLNPNAPMKDSGIDWLGEMPAHWEVAPLKRHWSVTDCKHLTAEFVDDGIPLASIREVQSYFVNLDTAKQTTDVFYGALTEGGRQPGPGDLIFSRNATVGEVAQVADWHPPFAMGQDVCLLRRTNPASSPDFVQMALRSSLLTEQLATAMIGSTFKRVNVEEIRKLTVVFPPTAEQADIVRGLQSQVQTFDVLNREAESAIALFQERRAALISAAVTGKIDVRGIVAAPAKQEAA